MDMRVANAYNTFSVYNVKNSPAAKKLNPSDKAAGTTDTFTLSSEVADYQFVKKAIAAAPDIREEKISPIKARLTAGDYSVNANDIAAKMFQGWNE